MKKIILILTTLIAGYSYLLYADHKPNLHNFADGQYLFTNYSQKSGGIINDNGISVAFDNNGDVGYTGSSSTDGGLSIGEKTSSGYSFTNYNSATPEINSNYGNSIAFDNRGDVGYVSDGGGLSVGAKSGTGSNITYTFKNYNDTTDGITNNSGFGVAFDNIGDVGYVSFNGGLSIGSRNGSTYTFKNYNASSSALGGITNNNGYGVAFDSNGDVGYASFGGGLSIGIRNGANDYNFTNYNSSTNGITNNYGFGVAFDSDDGNVAYASDNGLSIGVKSGTSYNFKNYNVTDVPAIGSNNGRDVAFDSKGDVGYSSGSVGYGGLSIGVKSADNDYNFTYYNANNEGITNDNGNGVAFDNSDNVGYASNGGGLSIGISKISATVNTTNILYDENNNNLENFDIENGRINLSGRLNEIVTNNFNTFVQIRVTSSDTSDQYAFIEYITNDGTIAEGNRDSNYNNYQQYARVQPPTANNDYINLPNLINGGNGFEKSTTLTFSVEYGTSQSNLTEALPATGNTITTPATNIADNAKYSPGSFSPTDGNYFYNENNNIYELRGTTLNPLMIGFESAINSFVNASENYFLQITVTNPLNENTNDYYQSVYYFTSDGISPGDNGIPQRSLGNVLPISVQATDNSTINNFFVNNLTPDTSYNLQISLGPNQATRYDLLRDGQRSTIVFATPMAPAVPSANGNNDTTRHHNNGLVAGTIVGGAAVVVVGAGGMYFYTRKKKIT